MPLINWEESLSVKVSEIDTQHKKLVELINKLHEAMKERKANTVLGGIIDELVDYAINHFRTEESYFDKFGYLKAVQHRKEHKDFVSKVAAFKDDFARNKIMLSMEIMEFLKAWLINHIKKIDMAYSDFFIEKGLK
ncbi:MAG: hemerythrin family protein [Deltaproteobacteria bacterium]|nr:hemerythrin family protein [Deltaproteobacteria bacterium]